MTSSPKNPDPSKVAILRTRTPAIQVQTLPLEGPRILREEEIKWSLIEFTWFMNVVPWKTYSVHVLLYFL